MNSVYPYMFNMFYTEKRHEKRYALRVPAAKRPRPLSTPSARQIVKEEEKKERNIIQTFENP